MNLKEQVHAKISGSNSVIAACAVEAIAQKVIDKRITLVVSAYTEIDNLEKELRRVKPDQTQYTPQGEMYVSYSKEMWEKKDKLEGKIHKIQKLLDAALGDQKFNELASAMGQQGDK
jgi:hypothetical protein